MIDLIMWRRIRAIAWSNILENKMKFNVYDYVIWNGNGAQIAEIDYSRNMARILHLYGFTWVNLSTLTKK